MLLNDSEGIPVAAAGFSTTDFNEIDHDFASLPFEDIAASAISTATQLGASWVDIRVERGNTAWLLLRDSDPEATGSSSDVGLGVRVIVDGVWGFASDPVITAEGASRAAVNAVNLARISRPLSANQVTLVSEKVIGKKSWTSRWVVDPFTVPTELQIALMKNHSEKLFDIGEGVVDHVDASCSYYKEQKFYGDISGNRLCTQRIRIEAEFTATSIDEQTGRVTTVSTHAQPTARGWEWMDGSTFDWDTAISELPALLIGKINAPVVTPGVYDLVIEPSQLWLTIHESIGHATELDRVLGFEANYAGTTFASLDMLGNFQYGTPLLNIQGDRDAEFGLASVGFDDEGVEAQSFPIITQGVLQDFQCDRATASLIGRARSNGCAYADSFDHVPIQRMPNVSMLPDPNGPSLGEMIAGVKRGLLVKGDDSWSIDMQRHNFQFTADQFWLIEDGKITGQVRDAAYQSSTAEFWGSLVQVGNPSTYILDGALNCGKGQPGQSAPVSHGAPAARFNQINILDVSKES